MPAKKKQKPDVTDASPSKSLARELKTLEANLQRTIRAYREKLGADLGQVQEWNAAIVAANKTPPREQMRDIGDMLGLVGKLKIKPEKGRRRDLRKIDSVIEDLLLLARHKRAS